MGACVFAAAELRKPPILADCDHPAYGHLAMLNPETRAELARDQA